MPGNFNPKGPIETPTSTQSSDGVPKPTGSTLPAGAAGKDIKDPNRK